MKAEEISKKYAEDRCSERAKNMRTQSTGTSGERPHGTTHHVRPAYAEKTCANVTGARSVQAGVSAYGRLEHMDG